jgi:hypothetical protein
MAKGDFERYASDYGRYVEAMIALRGSAPIPSFREWIASSRNEIR